MRISVADFNMFLEIKEAEQLTHPIMHDARFHPYPRRKKKAPIRTRCAVRAMMGCCGVPQAVQQRIFKFYPYC